MTNIVSQRPKIGSTWPSTNPYLKHYYFKSWRNKSWEVFYQYGEHFVGLYLSVFFSQKNTFKKKICLWGLNFNFFEDLLSFSVHRGTEKIAGLWFAWGVSTQANTMSFLLSFPCYSFKLFCEYCWYGETVVSGIT